jgi:DNA modification methylase
MLRKSRTRVEKRVDIISSSRYISHVRAHGNRLITEKLHARFIGRNGVFVEGNCLDLLANMRPNCVDLVFLDPPFNIRKPYDLAEFDDDYGPEFYKGLCRTWILESVRVLRPGGALFIYHLPKVLMDLGAWLNSMHLVRYKAWIALKMKSGFPIRGRIHPAHYGLLYYTKADGQATFNVVRQRSPKCRKCGALVRDYGGYRDKYLKYEHGGDLWVQISDFWDDTRPASHDKLRDTHMNELPLQIPERAILLASKPGDVILDCFAGGGSTLQAAEQHGRNWIGVDIASYRSSLRRIKAFLDSDESATPTKRLRQCFKAEFTRAALTINPKARNRPIREAHALKDVSGDTFKSKSKIFAAEPTRSTENGASVGKSPVARSSNDGFAAPV